MKIKTIGTGNITSGQRSASTLIDDTILVDCGNGIVKTLQEQDVDIANISTILITHLHGDHFMDIPFLVTYRSLKNINNELVIYCPGGTGKAVDAVSDAAFPDLPSWRGMAEACNIKLQEADSFEDVRIAGKYSISSFPVVHGELSGCRGYIINDGTKSVALSGDSAYCDSIEEAMDKADVAVLDMTDIVGGTGHMGVNDISFLSKQFKDKKIITTHMSREARANALCLGLDNVIVSTDGNEIVI